MEKLFTISQTANLANVTAETLRHYDRIDLLKPCKIDEWTNYRYYSEQEIVKLSTIYALRCMDLPLKEIKEILEISDFEKIIEFLSKAEKSADRKINELKYAQSKIITARQFYESKKEKGEPKGIYIKDLPQRAILLSEELKTPSLENLWDYHRHFYKQVGDNQKKDFSFEDMAGIYEEADQSNLFAICKRFTETKGLKILPKGKYLCIDSTESNRDESIKNLRYKAKHHYGITPEFTLQLVVLSGILKWNYQIQVFIGND